MTTEHIRPPKRRSGAAEKIVRFISILGITFVLAGIVTLFFTGYLLWGTGVYTKNEQEKSRQELASKGPTLVDGKVPENIRPDKIPALGEPLFTIKIPDIGLDTVVHMGVGREELKKGPGLFPSCSDTMKTDCVSNGMFPGEKGNVAISGHRTTYGAPFFRLNELKPGSNIDFISGRARYRYKVVSQEVVDPVGGFDRVEQHGKTELTLTTCNPKFSAAQRLIIHADYVGASLVSASPGQASNAAPANEPVVTADVLILASVSLAAALASLGLSKRYRKLSGFTAAGLVVAAGLWVGAFPRLLALMPANY